MRKEILALNKIAIGYDKKPIQTALSFKLEKGEALGVVGPNGSGKTTLFKTILGVIPPLDGEITFAGKQVKTTIDRNWARSSIGYVPQGRNRGKLPLTVEEMVLLGRWGSHFSCFRRPGTDDWSKTQEALEIMDLTNLKKRDCRNLSGGEYQRAVIARALAREASLLLLDEPTTFLDLQSRQEFITLLTDLREELGLSILIVSHHREELENLTDRVLLLEREKRGALL
ncbi:MAG TPA: metal ABC transporter ATP-binding protein [Firmicutes bacterium]|jgi:ABC-type Mn2+/Zn2+ transport system ATPase subunit|nr:metal ABC transporter ATP-binding protein [Bacillota bacterium]